MSETNCKTCLKMRDERNEYIEQLDVCRKLRAIEQQAYRNPQAYLNAARRRVLMLKEIRTMVSWDHGAFSMRDRIMKEIQDDANESNGYNQQVRNELDPKNLLPFLEQCQRHVHLGDDRNAKLAFLIKLIEALP